ncbi:threonine-phosphate decarboxylase [bacterium]|nr:MAG: threonine-phosphate decarboxylase [bacterium]
MINRIHGGNTNILKENRIVDFSASINPLGLPGRVSRIISRNMHNLTRYPQPESNGLKEAIAEFHNTNPENILIGNGSIELIHLIPRALKVRRCLIITPSFSEYEFAARLSGARTVFAQAYEKDGFNLLLSKFEKLIPGVDMVFLCNPNNPTGALTSRCDISALFEICNRHKVILVLDEVFMDFVNNAHAFSMASRAPGESRLIVINSLTKFFALAGLRVGYLISSREITKKIAQFQYPWNVNVLAQEVSREIITDKEYIRKSKALISRERAYLFGNLRSIKGLKVFTPGSNFILCKLEGAPIKSAKKLQERLLKFRLLIRDCSNFRGLSERFFRVAVRTRRENNELILGMGQALR